MIDLKGIVKAVDRMTEAMNNLASAVNRAATLYEASRQPSLLTPIVEVIPPSDSTGGRGW